MFREQARDMVYKCAGADRKDHTVLFTSGCTSSINLLCRLIQVKEHSRKFRLFSRRPIVIGINASFNNLVSLMNHHSNLLPWRESGADIVTAPNSKTGDNTGLFFV
jgi:selenocysteine lyase/cysteine desulfurase